jgi:hypothetical protein
LYVIADRNGCWYLDMTLYCSSLKYAHVFDDEHEAEKERLKRRDAEYFHVVTLKSAQHFEALGENRLVRSSI